ncbi:hypothetical protein TNIN_473331 [Trichonephila inaurata madagascariensis]|uniref:Uncharacterized protein n=1 Tax=Trichonephila inaurata madagascariensis TaxID=2747483 RepID=A0A8X6XDA9_9ARAC|nr:hypothetical protein TNIN_473331 [Trichonephila inaurata madagascariensis]
MLRSAFSETGSFVRGYKTQGGTKVRGIRNEEHVLREFEQPETSTRTVLASKSEPKGGFASVGNRDLRPHAQPVPEKQRHHHPFSIFHDGFLQRLAVPRLCRTTCYSPMNAVSVEGIFKVHNAHNWTYTNPHLLFSYQ